MRLVRDVFIPFLTPPVAARSSVPALLFHFSAGRVNNEIYPAPLFFGLYKQLILLSCFSLKYVLLRRSHKSCAGCRRFWDITGSLDLDSEQNRVKNAVCPFHLRQNISNV